MDNKKVYIKAFVEESEFIDKDGKSVKFLRLGIPCTDSATKYIKAEQFVLQLAVEKAKEDEMMSNL